MGHLLAKTIIVNRVIELIEKEYKLTHAEASMKLLESEVLDLVDDDETGLYGESPLYVFSIFEQYEQKKKD